MSAHAPISVQEKLTTAQLAEVKNITDAALQSFFSLDAASVTRDEYQAALTLVACDEYPKLFPSFATSYMTLTQVQAARSMGMI